MDRRSTYRCLIGLIHKMNLVERLKQMVPEFLLYGIFKKKKKKSAAV